MNTLTAVGNALKAQETAATVAHTAAVSAEAAATTGATVAQNAHGIVNTRGGTEEWVLLSRTCIWSPHSPVGRSLSW